MLRLGGGRTPEELESLLEDAVILRDVQAVAELFHTDAAVSLGGGRLPAARGRSEIAAAIASAWDRRFTADIAMVVQAGACALSVGRGGTHVLRRSPDGLWQYLISVWNPTDDTRGDIHA